MTGEIPVGWASIKQGDAATFYNGRAYKKTEWEEEGTPVIRLQNLTGRGEKYYYSTLELPEHQYCNEGDLLYMWSATFGPHIWKHDKAIFHYHIWKIACDEIKLTKQYHYFLLAHLTQKWKSSANGMAMLHLTKSGMENLEVGLPPLSEQKRIAEVLTSVDEAIRATQAVIEQTRTVKKGLLQTLLTQGLGHTKFKPSPFGDIPESWEVATIGEISDFVTSGSRGWAKYYSDDGAIFVRITNLDRDNIRMDFSDIQHVALPEGTNEGTRTHLQSGDILISITADLGIVGFVEDDQLGEAYINQHIALVRPTAKTIAPGFLAYALSGPTLQNIVQKLNDAGAKSGLNLSTIRSLPVPLPPMDEQTAIYEKMTAVDIDIRTKQTELTQLQTLKSGLMSDLLTGRVRVRVNEVS